MPIWGKMLMTMIMTPVEILGKFTKPFALCIRLFANMTAGHVMVLALISIVFTFGSVLIGIAPVAMAVGIMMLEIFVGLLQAYVFTLLVSSFIGQIRTVEGH
jgi:F-type H+-transporting ATPase subunit a